MADPQLLYFNGINGATGNYLLPPTGVDAIAAIAMGEPLDARFNRDLAFWAERAETKTFGVAAGIDEGNLADTGWGVIFRFDSDPAIREALTPLLNLRKEQASKTKAARYKEFTGSTGYRPGEHNRGESNREFLSRFGVEASQPADPDRGVPYFLLIVGSPEQIPFRFQYQLDVQYAVGRIWFDTLEEYAQYAQSVVAAETKKVRVARKAVFFGVQNADDPATNLSATEMVKPLAKRMPQLLADDGVAPWDITTIVGDRAKKSQLTKLLGGSETPSLLFTASHGMGFPNGDPRQLAHQGALLCQDWPGPRAWSRAIPQDQYFSADDVSSDANLQGMITFLFACYGAGTPKMDDFAHQAFRNPVEIAPHAFVANLPRRLLGHPKGGALAVVGHVERAWGYSFFWNRIGRQLQTFESTLYQVMAGQPLGSAIEYFNTRYAALSTELTAELEEIKFGREPDNSFLAGTWTAHNDARSYVILGDPAVRLPLIEDGERESRTPATPIVLASKPVTPSPNEPAFGTEPQSGETIDTARTFQTSVSEIERLTGLDFGRLRVHDIQSVDSFAAGEATQTGIRIPLTSLDQIRLSAAHGPVDAVAFGTEATATVGRPNPREQVVGTDLSYYLLAYDANGQERLDHPAGKISDYILSALEDEPVTDVFLFSHGWQGDVPAAKEQYQGWLKTMADCAADRARIRTLRPGFRPLLIGLHWPSEPWGDESLSNGVSFEPGATASNVNHLVEDYATRLGDSSEVRRALTVILEAAQMGMEPDALPGDVLAAYKALDTAVGLPKGGVAGTPGADWDGLDPEGVYESARRDTVAQGSVSFGLFSRDTLLAPLRVLSFWKMKDRARVIGETAVHPLMRSLQQATAGRDVRFHLAGHSFGCIVVSAAVAGPPTSGLLARPVDSLVLLQGALSLWSYCSDIPEAPGKPGYFHRIVSQGLVRGPIVTTQSRFDSAVGTWYPRAASVAGQVVFAGPGQLPKYGAVGTFGIQVPGMRCTDIRMLSVNGDYAFRLGQVYNVESSQFISVGSGLSGAHSDIRKLEVAHVCWEAAIKG